MNIIGFVDFGHFYLRPSRELAIDLYKYNTPFEALKFILSLKPLAITHTIVQLFVNESQEFIELKLRLHEKALRSRIGNFCPFQNISFLTLEMTKKHHFLGY